MKNLNNISLDGAKNIGSTIQQNLQKIGVHTLADLAEITPAVAYNEMQKQQPDKHLPVCYYLYSLQGALMNVHWEKLPNELKQELKLQVEKIN